MSEKPVDIEDLRQHVQLILDEFLDRQREVLGEVAPDCLPLVDYTAALVRGGKRLRPAFCYWGWRAAITPPPTGVAADPKAEPADLDAVESAEAVVRAAAALELFQAGALIHDDVMDASDTRRGMPSVHRRFEALHTELGAVGDPARFGEAAAILAGDLCMQWTDELLTHSGLCDAALRRARIPFDRMRTQLMGGQYLDILEQAIAPQRTSGAVAAARRVVQYKSAKYSIEEPLLIGGAIAGAGPALMEGYSRLGLPLGEAFQLRDDLLGVYGDPAVTGKPAGDDLREGKRTMLIALAMERAKPTEREQISRLLGSADLDADGIEWLRAILISTGARDAIETMVGELAEQSRGALAQLQLDPHGRRMLAWLIDAATSRAA